MIKDLIRPESINEVNKVTGATVKVAACRMKPNKTNVVGGFTSDCLFTTQTFFSNSSPQYSRDGWFMAR